MKHHEEPEYKPTTYCKYGKRAYKRLAIEHLNSPHYNHYHFPWNKLTIIRLNDGKYIVIRGDDTGTYISHGTDLEECIFASAGDYGRIILDLNDKEA